MSVIRVADDSSQTEIPTKAAVSAIAIDLRSNVGGYMPAGVGVAKTFLPPRARIILEVDKIGRAKNCINDGVGSKTDTTTALFVLVDKKTVLVDGCQMTASSSFGGGAADAVVVVVVSFYL